MSQEPSEDVKPKLNLKVVFEGDSITIKVRPSMPFGRIFQAAEKRFEKEPGTFRYTFEGKRVNPEDTPGELGMEEGDQIDAFLGQVGGCRR